MNKNNLKTTIANRLKTARELAGFSQADAASALTTSQDKVSRNETGKQEVKASELVGYAKLYRKPITYFYLGDII